MKPLIRLYSSLLTKQKPLLFVLMFTYLFTMFVYTFSTYTPLSELSYIEYMMIVFGGIQDPFYPRHVLLAILIIFPTLLVSQSNVKVYEEIEQFVLVRIERRSQIWRTVCFTQAIFSVGCMLFLFILYSLIGLIFTNRSMTYGSHSVEFFWYWQEHGPSGWETLFLIFFNLMIGMYFLVILQQFVQLFFEDKGHFLIGFIAIIATTLAIERMGIISNLFELFYYPFWLNLYTYTFSYWIDIAVKLILIIVIYFSGHFLLDNQTVKRLPTY